MQTGNPLESIGMSLTWVLCLLVLPIGLLMWQMKQASRDFLVQKHEYGRGCSFSCLAQTIAIIISAIPVPSMHLPI